MILEHLNLSVSDYDASVGFYMTLFDLQLRWQGSYHGRHQRFPVAHLGNDQFYLSINQAEDSEALERNRHGLGLNHFGFIVTDLGPYRARLDEMGVKDITANSQPPGKRIYFYDPDGFGIELVQY